MLENGTSWEPLWFPVEIGFNSKSDTRLVGVAVASHDESSAPASLDYRSLKLSYRVPATPGGDYLAMNSPTLAPTAATPATFSPTLAPTAAKGNSPVSIGK